MAHSFWSLKITPKRALTTAVATLLILALIPIIILGVFVVLIYIANKQEVQSIHKTLSEEQWVEYKDDTLGLSFSHPALWKITSSTPSLYDSYYGSSYKLTTEKGWSSVSFYKNPSKEWIQNLLYDSERKKGNATFNGKSFITIPRSPIHGMLYIPDDYSLIIEASNTNPDSTIEARHLNDQVFQKIIQSIKLYK